MRKGMLALASLTIATVAYAAGGQEVTTEFYNNKSHAKLVGEIITGCGPARRWGKTTPFSEHSPPSPCDTRRVGAGTSIAASSLMHHDQVAACKWRCSRIPIIACPPPSPEVPECVQPRIECAAACDTLLTPPEE